MKKIITNFIAVALTTILLVPVTAFASETSFVSEEPDLSVNCENVAEELAFLNDTNGTLGTPFYSYEYKDNTYEKTSYAWYPIIENNSIKSFVLQNIQNANDVQLTDCYVSELNKYYLDHTAIALIYDANACYAASSNGLAKIGEFGYIVKERDTIEAPGNVIDLYSENIEMHVPGEKVSSTEIMGAKKNVKRLNATASEANLTVPFVSQNPPSNICWAASVACIGNYLTSNSYTAKDIAQSVFGNSWNQAATISTAMTALKSKYNVSYTKIGGTAPSDSKIYNNISAGYPVYSTWKWTNGSHATVIRGIKTGSYVFLMDPEYGYNVANKTSGVYSYTSGYSGVKLTLSGYGTKY